MECFEINESEVGEISNFTNKGKINAIELDNMILDSNLLAMESIWENSVGKLYSLNAIEIIENESKEIAKLKKTIDKSYFDPDFIGETVTIIEKSIGVNRLINTYGNYNDSTRPIVTPFDKNSYEALFKEDFTDKNVADQLFDKMTNKDWPLLTDIGTVTHNILEDFFIGKLTEEEIKTKYDNVVNNNNAWKNSFPDNFTSSVLKHANSVLKAIKDKHGDDCKILTEVEIKSLQLNEDFMQLTNSGKNSVNGRIDLLIIDSNNKAHIYDYKISRKEVGDWNETDNALIGENQYPSTKKLQITNQLACYKAILQQYRIEVESASIIPLTLDSIEYENQEKKAGITKIGRIIIPNGDTSILVTDALSGTVYNNIVTKIIPVKPMFNSESLHETNSHFQRLFNLSDSSSEVVRRERTFESYKKFIKKGENKGKIYYHFNKLNKQNGKDSWVKRDTEAEIEEALRDYVDELNNERMNELYTLSGLIKNAIKDPSRLADIANNYPNRNKTHIIKTFKKYINLQWDLVSTDDLIKYGVFVFKKDNKTEIVTITTDGVNLLNNLGQGRSILGHTHKDEKWDKEKTLQASNGVLSIMKAMCFIEHNQDMFVNNPVQSIIATNLWSAESEISAECSFILDNWRQLHDSLGIKDHAIDAACFVDEYTSLLNRASDAVASMDKSDTFLEGVVFDANDVEANLKIVTNSIKKLQKKYTALYSNPQNAPEHALEAYNYLNKLMLTLKGYTYRSELDIGEHVDGINLGLYSTSSQFSPSVNALVISEMFNRYTNEVRAEVDKRSTKFASLLLAYSKEKGISSAIGGEWMHYKELFVTDDNGKISNKFRFKNPNHSDFDAQPATRALLKYFLEVVNDLKFDNELNKEDQIQSAILDGTYYDCPLMEGSIIRQTGELGVVKTFKNKWQELTNLYEGVFASQTGEKQEYEKTSDKLFNRFKLTADARNSLIEENGVGFFDTNIEDIFLNVVLSYSKEKVSNDYVPVFNAMKLGIAFMNSHGAKMDNIASYVDKLIQKKVYGDTIMQKSLQKPYKLLATAKQMFSTLNLAFNVKSYARETLSGAYTGLSRSVSNMIQGVTKETYVEGVWEVIKNVGQTSTTISLLQQLNSSYGVTNYSLNEIPGQKRVNWAGVANMRQETLFLTASSPDFQHRMAILIAKMKGDGCWDAHSLDSEGVLKYDFKKDIRFKDYIEGNTASKNYLYQKSLYLSCLTEWNEAGHFLKEGDDLPRAYTIKEASSIKNFSDLLYGHYDSETRALINDQFIGAFWMQFKTYSIARAEQWILKPGKYKTGNMKQQYSEDGEEIWVITTQETETSIPVRNYVRKSDVTEEQKSNGEAMPYIAWEGEPIEGIFYSLASYLKAIKDPKEFKKLWKDPVKKRNLWFALFDMGIMSIWGALIAMLFGDKDNLGWSEVLAYDILTQSTQDANILNVTKMMWGDLNPPLHQSVIRMFSDATSLATGNKNALNVMTGSIGLLRPLNELTKE